MKSNPFSEERKEHVSQNIEDNSQRKVYTSHPQLFEIQNMDNERLLTKQEIADFLNVSVKMIDRKVSLNEIPYLKIGRLVRFRKKEVLAWAEGNISKR